MQHMVHICCNDPDNGIYAGEVSAMQLLHLDLEPSNGWPKKITVEGNRIKIGRRWYRYTDSKYGVGNWCWNGYWMARTEAKRLLRDLKASGNWSCVSGPTMLFDWFERK